MMIGRVFQIQWCAAGDRDLDAALALVGIPNAVIEAKLYLLLDVAGEIIGRHPAGVNVERCFSLVWMNVNHLQLYGIPGGPRRRADQTALAGGADAGQSPIRAESEINQLDVMDRDVGAGVATHDPLGELAAADLPCPTRSNSHY